MSDFFRIPVNPALHSCGLTTLARLAHHAENTSDDVLLIQVQAETQSRSLTAQRIMQEEYIRLHRESPKECRAAIVKAMGKLPE